MGALGAGDWRLGEMRKLRKMGEMREMKNKDFGTYATSFPLLPVPF
jgi:hypothetical protein